MSDELPTVETSPWLTLRETAARAKCSERVVSHAIKRGRLKAARIGARSLIRVHVLWVDAWLDASVVVNPSAPGENVPRPLPFKNKL